MNPQTKFICSAGSIIILLAMLVMPKLPDEPQPTPTGWVGYGIIIGLLLGVAIKAFVEVSQQTRR